MQKKKTRMFNRLHNTVLANSRATNSNRRWKRRNATDMHNVLSWKFVRTVYEGKGVKMKEERK